MAMSGGRRIAKEKMLCMFCDKMPCECNKRESPVKPSKKTAPAKAVTTKPRFKAEPERRAVPVRTENEDWAAIRVLFVANMLHPKEVSKWQDTALLGLVSADFLLSQSSSDKPKFDPTISPSMLQVESLPTKTTSTTQATPKVSSTSLSTTDRLTQWKERRRATWK